MNYMKKQTAEFPMAAQNSQPFWLEKTNWIPAFAGMTGGFCVSA
jgi:hypothetical protein